MNDELKTIKKIYGEEMMHMCREMFPTILEEEGKLLSILKANIAPSHSFAIDIKENALQNQFENWIYSLWIGNYDDLIDTGKTPFELMEEAGYTLYECKSESDIQKFRKYYEETELLCTFRGNRLDNCYVFFAVKKNALDINRSDFKFPQREDEYGRSVISIQFSRGETNTLSIKNRYNHRVQNPDATFSNNLENIIPGLTKSFENVFKLHIFQERDGSASFLTNNIPYKKASDGRFYRYNVEDNGVYYCENNVIIDGNNHVVTTYAKNPERFIIMDHYILDLKDKNISFYVDDESSKSFIKSIMDIGSINKIIVTKNGNNRIITFKYDDEKEVKVEINENNAIVGYENSFVKHIGEKFMNLSKNLVNLSLPQVETIDNFFLSTNRTLSNLYLPNVREIGDYFACWNDDLTCVSFPNLEKIGSNFLRTNVKIENVFLPKAKVIGDMFMFYNQVITSITLPSVTKIGSCFLGMNLTLNSISLPNVEEISYMFLWSNRELSSVSFPKLKMIGNNYLYRNQRIDKDEIESMIEKNKKSI